MTLDDDDAAWMKAALTLSERGRGLSTPNPNVGCVLVKAGNIVGRGWTQAGGRPHAEYMALAQAGALARGATCHVTLEPCAHQSDRGPSCTTSLIDAGVAKVRIARMDPDERTNGAGARLLRQAGVDVVTDVETGSANRAMAGWFMQKAQGRPLVTLKLATSLDGCIARADGESKWITGEAARAHAHLERARCDMILVGRGTYVADQPALDVRLPGLEQRSPARAMLTRGAAPEGWMGVADVEAINSLPGVQNLLVEGGAQAAAAFLNADLVDRVLLYRAPIMVGAGKASLGDIGLDQIAAAHGRWHRVDKRMLGIDTLEVYERI